MTQAQTSSHGFKLIEKRFIKEANAECYYFEHIKSGAKLLKIANSDENKTFSISFKTVPYSDNGIAHIMEHSVLNGSNRYPVKSPFDVLMKGSLKTFINAFTSKDYTMYPFASMNDKDYFNLMNVYMDAVFYPLIYKDPRILKQEGWHYELSDKDSPVIYKGVVYNEMKGAFSSASRELNYQIYKNLLPDSPYGYESGGYPSAIPSLTYKEFLDFHQKYYSPENSYILLYGNADMNKELEFLDKEYLSNFTKKGFVAVFPDQPSFSGLKTLTEYYPVLEDAETKGQTFLTLNLVAGNNTDYVLGMAMDIICDVVFNNENAPVRLALQNAGIGKDVGAYCSNFKQNVISITVRNAEVSDQQKFYDVVISTLKDIVSKGIDMKEVEGVLNREEFRLREGSDAQKGISSMSKIQAGWFFSDDPFIGLEYEKMLKSLKFKIKEKYLEQLISDYFINNKHALLLSLAPKPGLEKERNAQTEKELAEYKKSLSPEAIENLIIETNQLIEFQKTENTPEALATIPLLTLADVNPKATWYGVEEKQAGSTKVLFHEEFTNNIIYSDLYFDMKSLPVELIPYASLLSNLLTSLDTKNYSFGDLNRELNVHTGGFYTGLDNYFEKQDDNKMLAKFTVSAKVMNDKTDKLFELTSEILNQTLYSDSERLKSLIVRLQSQIDASIKRDGSRVAASRLSSYFSNRGVFNELTAGLDFYWFISKLATDFDSKKDEIVKNLQLTAKLLFTRENIITGVTCSKEDFPKFQKSLTVFLNGLSAEKPVYQTWNFNPEIKNEGILTPSKVQYVIAGYDYKKLGYSWNGKMRVLNQIISRDWLTNQVRVIGGAYGGYANISPNGTITFNSYRDPNLKKTIENYINTYNFLKDFKADENAMTRFILGTISGIDTPLTPAQKGDNAYSFYFTKRSLAEVQKDRDDILSTKAEDIVAFAKMIKDVMDKNVICVYGNKDKINNEKDSFKALITLEGK